MKAILDQAETFSVDLVAKVAPGAAPIPTAYLVGRATVNHLSWPSSVALIAAVIIECLGLASTSTALTLWDYNRDKSKTDPGAPFYLAASLVLVYFLVATGLTVALDIYPALASYAPAIFPALSLTGVTILALRADHRRRLQAIETFKAERKEARQNSTRKQSKNLSNNGNLGANLDGLQASRQAKIDSRMDALLDAFFDNPHLTPTEAARRLSISRQTVYNYLEALENAGKVHRNGNGVKVLR